jgi:tetrahydromethanopterin S-methyltransferase subunit G
MSNEDFQKKVLEQLNKLDEGQQEINKRLDNIEIKLDGIE